MENIKPNIDSDLIQEFPPSYNKNNNQNQELDANENFEEFAENFRKKLEIQKKEAEQKAILREIDLENIKQKFIEYKNFKFFLQFICYSNLNFILLSENKKIGNLYLAEVEEPEYRIEDDEDIDQLPPEYEIKCLLGNRFDNLNSFVSNFISSNLFNSFHQANKALYERPKFIFPGNEIEKAIIPINSPIDDIQRFYQNPKSFYNTTIRSTTNLMISLDLKIEKICNKDEDGQITSDKIKEFDEFQIADVTSDFCALLKNEILNILN